jgi:hypothetical protein
MEVAIRAAGKVAHNKRLHIDRKSAMHFVLSPFVGAV